MSDFRQPAIGGMFPTGLEQHDIVGRARGTDPDTSHDAARKHTRRKARVVRSRVIAIFDAQGPMTDAQLVDHYRALYGKDTPESTIRTRRHELTEDKQIEPLTTVNGKTVWRKTT